MMKGPLQKTFIPIAIITFLFIGSVFASNTGKIRGIVKEAATGQPLPGANVRVVGTQRGASTDLEGRYVIIGLPPGTYSLKVTYMGFQDFIIKGVSVVIDRSTEVNFEMKEKILEFGEVVVVAERPKVALDVSSSKVDIDMEYVKAVPLSDFDNLLNLQPGTVFRTSTNDAAEQISTELLVRGGTGVGIFVDGLNITEAMSSGSITNFNMSALQASELLTGGFNAEYGNIRSGVINVVTKEGSDKYHLSVDYKISPAARKHFGPSLFDKNDAPEWLLYGTEEALYGPDGTYDPDNLDSYWEKWAVYDTVYNFNAEQAQQVWKYQHRERPYGHKPDYIVDGSLGGPIPILKNYGFGKNITFFTSLRYEYNMLAIPLTRDHFTNLNWFWKITVRPKPLMKLNFQGNYQQNFSSTTYNTPHISVATPEQSVFSMQYTGTKYYDGMRSLADRYRNQYGLSFTHILSQKTFYDVKLSYLLRRSFVNHADLRSDEVAFVIGGAEFDSSPQGGWVPIATVRDFGGRESDFGMVSKGYSFQMGGDGKERDYSREALINARFDLVSQVNNSHHIKTGFGLNYNDMDMYLGIIRISPPIEKIDQFRRRPMRLSSYLQDLIEVKGMIANLGVRLDYTNRSGTYYTDLFSTLFEMDSLQYIQTSEIEPFFYMSPRVGVSHPISERSKLFFNYGHFYDEPGVNYLYRQSQRYGGDLAEVANANLKPQRTIAYELGFEQQIGDRYLFHLSGFYRDITNQIKSVKYYSLINTCINSYTNDNYADIRGFEVLLQKGYGNYILGTLSYDYLVRSSGSVGLDYVFADPLKTPKESSRRQWTPGADYNFVANVTFKTPAGWGRKILGAKLFGNWMLNITHEYQSGRTFTWNPKKLPGVQNNVRWKPHQNTNIRLSKQFIIGKLSIEANMEVFNLFNRKELSRHLRSMFLPQLKLWDDYMESLELPEEGGNDQPGDYDKDHIKLPEPGNFPNQLLFLRPRDIFFGIRVNF
ncbi:MAG: TonB-dependent receptor [Candidatus Marinimicrobia bacterium]|nr:TonB-dependent receptor [bacterium]MCG2714979.1 TonB-dependent receptor [Candidatus Neomarinimicrobiota bacterium]